MTTRYCCPECFDDRGLRENIIPPISDNTGKCDFCKSETVPLVEPKQLRDYFEMLVGIYDVDPHGKTLVEWMKDDWALFSLPQMDIANAKDLLAEILDNGEIVRQTFSPSASYSSEGLIYWETLRDEILYKNRYFLDQALDMERLRELLSYIHAKDMPDRWYRARILNSDKPFQIQEMGAPPKHLATPGRANPIGIPYLYLGSHPETAIAEIRPHTGEQACVADFSLTKPLKAVDLRNPRKLVTPFELVDASEVGQMRADLPLLERLGNELTRPVLPRSAAIDYIPSQYLCELIKKLNYDGVVYRSSVSSGINLALFNPEQATGGTTTLYNVSRVHVEVVAK